MDDPGGQTRIDRRKVAGALLIALVLSVGAAAALAQAADPERMADALERADGRWLVICAAALAARYIAFGAVLRGVAAARGGPRLPWRLVGRVALVRPTAQIASTGGALAVDGWALHRAGADAHQAARRVVAMETLRWLALGALAASAAAATLATDAAGVRGVLVLAWLAGPPLAVAAAFVLGGGGRRRRLADPPRDGPREGGGAAARWARWARTKVRRGVADLAGALGVVAHVLARPRRHAMTAAALLCYWGAEIVVLAAALRAFGADVAVPELVLAFATAQLVTLLPLPGAGSGGFEAALASTLNLLGTALGPALLAAILFRVVTFWIPILLGLAMAPTLRRLRRDLPATQGD